MIALLEVVRREVDERRLYLAGGLLLGLLPLLAPLLPWAAAQPAMEVREATAVTLFWIASLIFSVLLGGAVFGGDLAERRLSFYFSRPLSGWAVLGGKLAATLLVGFTATALVLLPSVALGWRLPQFFRPGPRLPAACRRAKRSPSGCRQSSSCCWWRIICARSRWPARRGGCSTPADWWRPFWPCAGSPAVCWALRPRRRWATRCCLWESVCWQVCSSAWRRRCCAAGRPCAAAICCCRRPSGV